MTKKTETTTAPLTDESLDQISGGPHWQTWDPPTYLRAPDGEPARGVQTTRVVAGKTKT
ncbi:MAG: hypothetical protein AAF674_04220 [Pseudomonadota bacterium]